MAYPSITATFTGPGNQGVQIGHNSGPIHVAAAERPETPPQPSCFVPFRRDADFVDRGTLLDQIRGQCSAPASRVALVGLGGVGKSQLAIEYCYRIAEQSPETWVFWAHASNTARLEQSYRDIADQVKLPGRKDPQADVFKLVHDWLRNEKNGSWLLVLDNADDAVVLSPPQSHSHESQVDGGNASSSALRQHLSRYLPPSRHGSILVTSRTKRAATQLVEDSDIIPIEPMQDAAAHALLRKKLGDIGENDDSITELATALEYMPLALVQAATYIRKLAPRCSVRQYLDEYHQSDKRKTNLLNHGAGHLRRDESANNSILLTWQISFNYIRSIRPSAADLLSLMSFFDRQGIHETLLRRQEDGTDNKRGGPNEGQEKDKDRKTRCEQSRDDNDSVSVVSMDDGFEDDVLILRDYSFITVTRDTNTFEMHSLVQLAMRKWLETKGQLEKWRDKFISNLCAELPSGRFENWEKCQALFPHARAALSQRPRDTGSLKDWAMLLLNAAWYAWERGRAAEADHMSTISMKVRRDILGMENAETLCSMSMVGLARSQGNRSKEVEELRVQVMETSKRVLGEEHPDTLTSMGNLALTYISQGRWRKAEELGVHVVDIMKRVLGEEHPDTLTSMGNLASTYSYQGRWGEAEELQVQMMERMKRFLGEEHPETLTTIGNLALTYSYQGRWREAEMLDVQVIEIMKRILGEEHPGTLTSIGNLALAYSSQGRLREAEELQVQVMEGTKRVLGEEHPHTLTGMGNLASTYKFQGRLGEAEELQVQVAEVRKRVLGEKHPDTLTGMDNLASTYSSQARWREAEELQVQVIEGMKRVLGEEHPDTLTGMANLASTYSSQSRWKEAESIRRQTLTRQEQVLGLEHLETLNSVYCLAHIIANRHCYNESQVLYERACAAYSIILAEDHPTHRACRQHFSEMLESQEQDRAKLLPETLDRGLSLHLGKESKLSRVFAKLRIGNSTPSM